MMKRITTLALLALLALAVRASRADCQWNDYRQPDGTLLRVMLCGDEHYTFYRQADGTLLVPDEQGFLRPLSASQNQLRRQQAHAAAAPSRRAPRIPGSWDAQKVYRTPVVLVQFSDRPFTIDNPKQFYERLFNEQGFNQGAGKGCVADYFREQSGGLFNAQFDVFGPVLVPDTARCYTGSAYRTMFRNALVKAVDSLQLDLSLYDWDGTGDVHQVVFIYSGYGGNDSYAPNDGSRLIHPHTTTISSYTSNGTTASWYSCSAELWGRYDTSCGIGTICHEFSHCLGLPDLYPTAGSEYSVVDEWDLMDGGNFTNWGWCPPNYSALERMLLGWQTPTELTEPTSIDSMKAVSEGGQVYQVKHTDNEYYLLENRQPTGWDSGVPGKGLVVFHVDYSSSAWHLSGDGGSNSVNNQKTHHRYDLVHADNMGYDDWVDYCKANKLSQYVVRDEQLNSRVLSGSPYPYENDTLSLTALTDTTVPAATMFNNNAQGKRLLSKPIVNIAMSSDGIVSFDFMKEVSAVSPVVAAPQAGGGPLFDLAGRPVARPSRGIYISQGRKYVK